MLHLQWQLLYLLVQNLFLLHRVSCFFTQLHLKKRVACLQTNQDQRTRVQSMTERHLSLSSEFLDNMPLEFNLKCFIFECEHSLNPWYFRWQRICLQYRRCGFDPRISKIPWRRKWLPTPLFLHGESYGQRCLVCYCLWGPKETDTTIQVLPKSNPL